MKLYIFDMGGVLARDFDVFPEIAGRLGMAEAEFRRHAMDDIDGLLTGSITEADYWARFESATGVRAAENWWDTLFAPTVDTGVEGVIRRLRTGARVVCGTNVIASHYDWLVERGRYDAFDGVYASHQMGLRKPDPRFWLRILEAEGTAAGDTFFVDDMVENVDAARSLGIASHLFEGADGLEIVLAGIDASFSGDSAFGDSRLEA